MLIDIGLRAQNLLTIIRIGIGPIEGPGICSCPSLFFACPKTHDDGADVGDDRTRCLERPRSYSINGEGSRRATFERERRERGNERESCSGSVTQVSALRIFLLCFSGFGAHDLVCFGAHDLVYFGRWLRLKPSY